MAKGRKPKPAAVKALTGNPGKRPIPKEPKVEPGLPSCPSHLSGPARTEWKRLAPELDKLGLLRRIDRAAFAAYCEAYATWVEAKKLIKAHGLIYAREGLLKKNPAVDIARDAMVQIRHFAEQFGLTPASRSKVAGEASQPLLPGIGEEAVDPNKPALPEGPWNEFSDEDYFDVGQVRH